MGRPLKYKTAADKKARNKAAAARYYEKIGPEARRKLFRDAQRRKRGCGIPTRPEPKVCECCKHLPTRNGRLHADHDHETGAFRGWLCNGCNTGIGFLGDNLIGAENAVCYLTRVSAAPIIPHDISQH